MKEKLLRFLPAAALALLVCGLPVAAQTFGGMSDLDNIANAGQQAGKRVVNIAFVFSGIVAAISLVPAGIKGLKGEPQARDAIVNVGIGAVAIFITLAVIKIVMGF